MRVVCVMCACVVRACPRVCVSAGARVCVRVCVCAVVCMRVRGGGGGVDMGMNMFPPLQYSSSGKFIFYVMLEAFSNPVYISIKYQIDNGTSGLC